MKKRLTIGVLSAALLASGMLMGVSYAGSGGITQPQVIELTLGGIDGGAGRYFPMLDEHGRRTGQINVLREPVVDADGNEAGNLRSTFLFAKGVVWQQIGTFTLKAGPHTGAGTVAVVGNFRGFSGESMAVVGGTGAYENARGFVTLNAEGDVFTYTLNLIP